MSRLTKTRIRFLNFKQDTVKDIFRKYKRDIYRRMKMKTIEQVRSETNGNVQRDISYHPE